MQARAGKVVVDTSAVLAVLLSEPTRSAVIEATEGTSLLAAPSMPWEVGNALVALVRRRLADSRDAQRAWTAFVRVPVCYVEVDVPAAIKLAVDHRLYAYDAYVIEVARSAEAPLLSLDRMQRRVAEAVGVEVMELTR